MLAILLNSGIRLVVLTSCSSAGPSPDDPVDGYNPGAFDGVAQRLLAASNQIAAVVAMQFDLEDWAAVEFSKSFYGQLVEDRDRHLDAIVAEARRVLSTHRRGEHTRTWITPVVYSRCRGGRVFELTGIDGNLSPVERKELDGLDELVQTYRRSLEVIARYPPGVQAYLEPELAHVVAELEKLVTRRQPFLGESVRISGGSAMGGLRTSCKLTLRTCRVGEIGEVTVTLEYPSASLRLLKCTAGAGPEDLEAWVFEDQDGRARLLFRVDGPRSARQPGEYELGVLEFEVSKSAPAGIAEIKVTGAKVWRASQPIATRGLGGLLFVQVATT